MSRASIRKRVAALNEAINPAGSLAAKLTKLTDEQRQEYRQWQQRNEAYFAANSGGAAYERFLSGEQLPMLRRDIRQSLFGPDICLPINATVADAMDAYNHQMAKGH